VIWFSDSYYYILKMGGLVSVDFGECRYTVYLRRSRNCNSHEKRVRWSSNSIIHHCIFIYCELLLSSWNGNTQ